jgi:large subunit ribosomal protein L25
MATTRTKITVDVARRQDFGKNACRRLRQSDRIPGNLYGLRDAPAALEVSPKRIEEVLHLGSGRNTLLTLSLDGGAKHQEALLREIQRDPVSGRLLHVDLMRIDPSKTLNLRVPVRLIGTPEGVKNEGGILDFVQREVEVSCLPDRIPEHLDVDISGLHLGQNLSVKELEIAEGVEILDDPETVLALVAAPRVAVEAAAAEEEPGEEAAEQPEEAKKTEEETEGGGD